MPRPARHADRLTVEQRGAIALVAWGRLTVAEAAGRLRWHPETVRRACKALFNVNPSHARRREADRQFAKAVGIGRRPLTKQQMRQAQERREAAVTPPNPDA